MSIKRQLKPKFFVATSMLIIGMCIYMGSLAGKVGATRMLASKGGGSTGGGSAYEEELKALAMSVVTSFELLHVDLVYGVSIPQLRNKIQAAVVDSTPNALFIELNGVNKRVDALNFPPEQKITLSLVEWPTMTDKSLKQEIALHEFLGLLRLEKNDYDLSSAILKKMNEVSGTPTSTLAGNIVTAQLLGASKFYCDSSKIAPMFQRQTIAVDLATGQVTHWTKKFVPNDPKKPTEGTEQWVENQLVYQITTLDVMAPHYDATEGLGINLVANAINTGLDRSETNNLQLIGIDAFSTNSTSAGTWKSTFGMSSRTSHGYGSSSIQMLCGLTEPDHSQDNTPIGFL